MLKRFAFIMLAFFAPVSASAADLCRALALRDVAASEDSSFVIPRGEHLESVTQFRRDFATGRTLFCSHGGYCYPTHVYIRGEAVEALRLVNCTVGAEDSRDEEGAIFAVVVDRERNDPEALRFDDIENQLLDFGACSACADNATQHYLRRPQGQCGILVRQALEGNPLARRRLADDFPGFCQWEYQ